MKPITVQVNHSNMLAETQFDGMKGSPQHAAMSMNRVWVNFKGLNDLVEYKDQVRRVITHLLKATRNYFFIGQRSANNDMSIRVYFLSKSDMEDFMVWAKLALPVKEEEE